MKNIRKTFSYQIGGIIGCFTVSLALYLRVLLSDSNGYNGYQWFNTTDIVFTAVLIIFLFGMLMLAFSNIEKEKENISCDIMADIGYFMYLIIFLIFINIGGVVNSNSVIHSFSKNGQEISSTLNSITEHYRKIDGYKDYNVKEVCGGTSEKLTNCMAKFLPSTYKRSGNSIITDDDKTYTFVATPYCCFPHGYSSEEHCGKGNREQCYIDIKNKKRNGKYVRIWLTYWNNQDFYLYSQELMNGNKRLRHIWRF